MTTHADHPTDTVNELLARARTCLAEGDLMQASAKGWGAAEQMVKAVAENRGWDHATHGDLYRAVHRLAEELSDQRLRGSIPIGKRAAPELLRRQHESSHSRYWNPSRGAVRSCPGVPPAMTTHANSHTDTVNELLTAAAPASPRAT